MSHMRVYVVLSWNSWFIGFTWNKVSREFFFFPIPVVGFRIGPALARLPDEEDAAYAERMLQHNVTLGS